MGKIFGNRWQITSSPVLGQGGQGHVFPVVDKTGEHDGEFALKRLINRNRFARFCAEVEAIKRLDHPNIIKLIDHSPLDPAWQEDSYLVMPVARGGHLNVPDRLSLYKDSVEATVQVATAIAHGLEAAHEMNIIHRDIKPQNILFCGIGHDLWISDFGICLLQDETERYTPDGEVVGPRGFTAPELEDGGPLEVSASVDIYSLGKLVYFMYSGGKYLPRERVHEQAHRQLFEGGERQKMLGLLIEQTVAPLDRRLQTIGEVLNRLNAIASWEQRAQLIPTSNSGLASIVALRQRARDTTRINRENLDARDLERDALLRVTEAFLAWGNGEFAKLAAVVGNEDDGLKCGVTKELLPLSEAPAIRYDASTLLRTIAGTELTVEMPTGVKSVMHHIQVWLCRISRPTVTVTHGTVPTELKALPMRDEELAVVFVYQQSLKGNRPEVRRTRGFVSKPAAIGTIRGKLINRNSPPNRRLPPIPASFRVDSITANFHDGASHCVKFRLSEWLSCISDLDSSLAEATSTCFEFMENPQARIGE